VARAAETTTGCANPQRGGGDDDEDDDARGTTDGVNERRGR
jgi:hypothetical protein